MGERTRGAGEKAAPEKAPPPRAPATRAAPAAAPSSASPARLEGEANAVALRVALGQPAGVAPPSPAVLAQQARRELDDAPAAAPPGDGGMREQVGRALGRDFSGVRLHTGADAAARTRARGADAATQGGDVWFAPGRFRPDRPLGRALIAHELVHTAQHGAAPPLEDGALHDAAHDALPELTPAPAGTLSLYDCGCSKKSEPEALDDEEAADEEETPAAPPADAKPQPAVPPEGFPANFAENYATIQDAVDDVNNRLKPTTPLDADWVRAMMAVETEQGTDARTYDPMQMANKGDPAFGILKSGGENTDLINPQVKGLLAGKKQTPRKGKIWNYAAVPEAERMDAATSIIAGVTWLAAKNATYANRIIPEGAVRDYTVKSGDSLAKIAGKEGSTTAHLQALNPDALVLHPGDVIKVQNAHLEWYISGWGSWEDAVEKYNGGGDPDYMKEVRAEYKLIKAAREPRKDAGQ